MIEKNIVDRVPKYAGRIKLTPVSGQPDLFTMIRADEPIVEGTPLDKATLDSIIKSRLTGRYYVPSVIQSSISSQNGLTVNPIPVNSWVQSSPTVGWTGSWTIESSSTDGSSYPWNVLDGNTATSWVSASGTTHTWKISGSNPRALKKFKVMFSGSMAAELQGSNDGIIWKHITHLSNAGVLSEYSVTSPVSYNFHRVLFTSSAAGRGGLNEFVISEYNIETFSNAFTIDNGFPIDWHNGQIAFVQIHDSVNTTGVISNTLNGITVNTILHPSRRYELMYNGTSFNTKEL